MSARSNLLACPLLVHLHVHTRYVKIFLFDVLLRVLTLLLPRPELTWQHLNPKMPLAQFSLCHEFISTFKCQYCIWALQFFNHNWEKRRVCVVDTHRKPTSVHVERTCFVSLMKQPRQACLVTAHCTADLWVALGTLKECREGEWGPQPWQTSCTAEGACMPVAGGMVAPKLWQA